MLKLMGKSTFVLENTPSVTGYASIVGGKEGKGPLGSCFDVVEEDSHFGKETWEQAESEMMSRTVKLAAENSGMDIEDINCIFAGDLLNQCLSATYGLRSLKIPFLGIYGACSTIAEGILLSSCFSECSGGSFMAATSSHFSTAERQFRFPLSYGGQRTPTAQWTCTASGAAVLSPKGEPPYIRAVSAGKIADLGVKDASNMGAVMAPAAAATISTYIRDMNIDLNGIDVIVTGDLGVVGSELLIDLLKKENIDITDKHRDCGSMIFDIEKQDVHSGGSGCGCSASVLCGYFLPRVKTGEIKEMLFIATGALLSPNAALQGETIPAIAHLVHISYKV